MKSNQVTITFTPETLRLIRHAARFWRQRLKTFIRLAVEFRAADVLNSVDVVPLKSTDRLTFQKIWELSREPGPLEKANDGRGSTSGIIPEDGDDIMNRRRKKKEGRR